MEVKRSRLREILKQRYKGNYTDMARDLGVSLPHLHKFLNYDVGGGRKLLGAVVKYCKYNNLPLEKYIDIGECNNVIDFDVVTNWEELFELTTDCIQFLIQEKAEEIHHELIIRTAQGILNNVGYDYSYGRVRSAYFRR